MDPVNPYSPPTVISKPDNLPQPNRYGRKHASYILLASVVLSLIYTFLDESVLRTAHGAWPVLFGTAAIAIVSVLVTRDLLLSPLCCFAGTMSGVLLAGLLRSWGYAQIDLAIPISIGFSIPSLIIGLLLRLLRRNPSR